MQNILEEVYVKVEVSGPLSEDETVGLFYNFSDLPLKNSLNSHLN